MIKIENVTKQFEDTVALKDFTCVIQTSSIFGLLGPNGSGKSTLMRSIAGVYKVDKGNISIDDRCIFDNPREKQKIFYVPDNPYFSHDATLKNTASLYRNIYNTWNEKTFEKVQLAFPIPPTKKIVNMSKGMQRQAILIIALSCRPKYLLLDEVFDGLDPIMRIKLKKMLIELVTTNETTVLIASHNLRELEDICDSVGVMENGGILLENDVELLKMNIHRIQIAFKSQVEQDVFKNLEIMNVTNRGLLYNIVVRGEETKIVEELKKLEPVFMEVLPLSLEEVFINEVEATGYDSTI